MPRRRSTGTVDWKISLPEDLALKIELSFYSKEKQRANYGARSRLICELLENYWNGLSPDEQTQILTLNR